MSVSAIYNMIKPTWRQFEIAIVCLLSLFVANVTWVGSIGEWYGQITDPTVILNIIVIAIFVPTIFRNMLGIIIIWTFEGIIYVEIDRSSAQSTISSGWSMDWDSANETKEALPLIKCLTCLNGVFKADENIDSTFSDDHCPVCLGDWKDLIGDSRRSFVVILPCSHQICLQCLIVTDECCRLDRLQPTCVLCRKALKFDLDTYAISRAIVPLRFLDGIGRVSRILQFPGDEIADIAVNACVKSKMDLPHIQATLKMMTWLKPIPKPWQFQNILRDALTVRIHKIMSEEMEEISLARGLGMTLDHTLTEAIWKEQGSEVVAKLEEHLFVKAVSMREVFVLLLLFVC